MACCVALGCHNRASTKGLPFYRFPADQERRRLWISAVKRDGWHPSEHSRLCCQHFVSGKKSDDPLSPDFVPSVFKHTSSPQERVAKKKVTSHERRNDAKKRKTVTDQVQAKETAAAALIDLSTGEKVLAQADNLPKNDPSKVKVREIGTQTVLTMEDIKNMKATNIRLQCSKQEWEKGVGLEQLSMDSFKQNNEKVTVFTGLPNFALLMQVFNLALPNLKERHTPLSPFHQLLLTLMRLRLNVTVQYLSYVFKVHHRTIVRHFCDVIHILNEKLVPLAITWPERSEIIKNLPYNLSVSFPNCVSIFDCFDVCTEKASTLDSKATTYSSYRSQNTVKYLISISPQGMVNFVSKGFGGETSYKSVIENCGFSNLLLPGDTVLADRDFTVEDSVGIYGANLKIPTFTKGNDQLVALEVKCTKQLEHVRIHIEQTVGIVQKKYSILDDTIPIALLQTDETTGLTTLDKIVRVSCGLTNICESVISLDPCS